MYTSREFGGSSNVWDPIFDDETALIPLANEIEKSVPGIAKQTSLDEKHESLSPSVLVDDGGLDDDNDYGDDGTTDDNEEDDDDEDLEDAEINYHMYNFSVDMGGMHPQLGKSSSINKLREDYKWVDFKRELLDPRPTFAIIDDCTREGLIRQNRGGLTVVEAFKILKERVSQAYK